MEPKMTYQLLECIAWYVCIFGVYGSIGLIQEEKEGNVRVMAVCMILSQGKHLLDQHHYKLLRPMFFQAWILKVTLMGICG